MDADVRAGAVIAAGLLVACGGSETEALTVTLPSAQRTAVASSTSAPILSAARSSGLGAPTLADAGAKTCSVGEPVELGLHGTGHAVLGFDEESGLAASPSGGSSLLLTPIDRNGTPTSPPSRMSIPADVTPHQIRAVDGHFVVALRLWRYQTQDLRWWTLEVDRAGHPKGSLVAADGAGMDEPSSKNQSASASDDPVTFTITNGAVPPPPGPGGMIREAEARPIFERSRAGQPVGDPLPLEWHGNPIARGMSFDSDVVWTGTHFLYPFWHDVGKPNHEHYVDLLLPIDCRPPHGG